MFKGPSQGIDSANGVKRNTKIFREANIMCQILMKIRGTQQVRRWEKNSINLSDCAIDMSRTALVTLQSESMFDSATCVL